MNVSIQSLLLSLTLIASSSAFARTIDCANLGQKSVDGIESIHFDKKDWEGSGLLTVVRNGASETGRVSMNGGQLLIGAPVSFDLVEESVTLTKIKGSVFELAKIRTTLSGEACDGYHSCMVKELVLFSQIVKCVDSLDAMPIQERCKRDSHGDCTN